MQNVFPFSRKKKLGLALGCGGAKGMAHLGVLKAFEESNVFFEEYAGTSIGSIVGALRAFGYTSDKLKESVFNIYLKEFVKYIRPYTDMQFVEELLNEYLKGVTFDELPSPFFAWATDKHTKEGVLLSSGSVARACICSSAIPPYFHSVTEKGRELIDGVYTNAIPADVLKNRGVRFIVGVDLNATSDEIPRYYNKMTKILSYALDSTVKITPKADALTRGYAACDVVIKPALERFACIDSTGESLELMYEEGYLEAKRQMPQILRQMKKKGVIS